MPKSSYSFRGFIKGLAISVIVLTFLSIFGFCVRHISLGGQRLGVLTNPLSTFVNFPLTVVDVFEQLEGVPPTYTRRDPSFTEFNYLKQDLLGLNAFFNRKEDRWDIRLFNFKNDSLLHQWELKKENFQSETRVFSYSEPRNCLLLPDSSIIVGCNDSKNLYRLNAQSDILWHNTEKRFHHSLNLSVNDNIWVCSSTLRFYIKRQGSEQTSAYSDDFITLLDREDGTILYDKSISEIFLENGLINFVYGFDLFKDLSDDPIHINDIEPVLADGPYWKKGDVFLSLRHRSLILLFRPSTNKIIHMLFGPFLNQHDVDIISNHEISIFNNNILRSEGVQIPFDLPHSTNFPDQLGNSEILIYNFADSSYRSYLKEFFEREQISTMTQGVHQILSTGHIFIESQNDGKMYIMNEDSILLQKYFNTSLYQMVERPHWVRLYETSPI